MKRGKKRKSGINLNIHLTNRWLYTLIALLIIAIVGVGVWAVDTTKGYHPVNQIDWAGGLNGNAVFNGNVGIGTTDLNSKLRVEGDIAGAKFKDTSNFDFYVNPGDSELSANFAGGINARSINVEGGNIQISGSGNPRLYMSSTTGGVSPRVMDISGTDWRFYREGGPEGTLEFMTIKANGNAMIGKGLRAGSGIGSGDSAIGNVDVAIYGASSSTFYGVGVLGHATGGTGATKGVFGRSDSPGGYDFYAGGAGLDYGGASSIRYKQNITELKNALQTIMALRGVEFDWDEEHGNQHDIGFIGEEVGKYIPEIVSFDQDSEDPSYYVTGMDYSKMTSILLEAIKELKEEKDKEIADLEAEIEELKKN